VVDGEGRILLTNPALEALLGWRLAERYGQPLARCLEEGMADPASALCWNVAVSEALAHGRTTFLNLSADMIRAAEDRQGVSVTGVVAPWQDESSEEHGALVVFYDSAQHQGLEDVRQRFLAVISHELGSPLTNVSTAAERVARLLSGSGAEEWRLIQIICSETARLRRLLGQFLSRSPVQAKPVQPERSVITLRPLLYRAAHTFGLREFEHEIAVQVPRHLPFVWGDADKILEILSNLVDNAIRYSQPGTEITLAAEAWRDGVLVSVTDQGQGIAAGEGSRVFEPLYRGSDGEQSIEGLGLGLYIARNLVQALGGELWHEGLASGGTRFCFTLPRADSPGWANEEG
jgi:two-component system phosphate regulon sensor histidine kinase PhoR